jgi:hypothetical protein
MKTLKSFIVVLAVSTAASIGALFMLTLNLSSEDYLAWIIGTLAAVILLFVAFLTFENNKKDNETFQQAMRREEKAYYARKRRA